MPKHTDDPGACPSQARCPSRLVAGAADLIDRHGLAKGRRRGPGPKVSVEGALQQAYREMGAVGEFHGWEPVRAAEHLVRRLTGDQTIEQWGDHTAEQIVVAELRDLATATRTAEEGA